MRNVPSIIAWLTTERLLTLLLLAAAYLGISGYSSDLFLHLSAGKYLVTTRVLAQHDPFSFTRPDAVWVMHEWLYQVAVYLVYAVGGVTALKLFGAAVVSVTLYLNRRSCALLGASQLVSWTATLLLFLTWLEFLGVRPQAVSYLFFALTLHLLLRYRYCGDHRAIYLMVLIMPIWVNSHGAFMLGLALPGYLLLLTLLGSRWQTGQWRLPRPLLVVVTLTLLTSLLNPYGYRQLLFPFTLMEQWAIRYLTEWQPPDLHLWNNQLYLLLVLIFVVAMLFDTGRERWFRLAFVAPLVAASFLAVRHLPLAALLIAPFLAARLEVLVSKVRQRYATSTVTTTQARQLGSLEFVFNWLVLAVSALGLLVSYPAYQRFITATVQQQFPVGATRYLMEHNVQGRMFTPMSYGDYILFRRYPQQKLFYDVRVEMYGAALARDYLTMVNALDGWQALFDRYAIDYVVQNKAGPLYAALLSSPAYRLAYADATSAVFMRTTTPLPDSSVKTQRRSRTSG